ATKGVGYRLGVVEGRDGHDFQLGARRRDEREPGLAEVAAGEVGLVSALVLVPDAAGVVVSARSSSQGRAQSTSCPVPGVGRAHRFSKSFLTAYDTPARCATPARSSVERPTRDTAAQGEQARPPRRTYL